MTKFYVIAGATRFYVKEIEADTKEQAEELAYETNPEDWGSSWQSDNFEHMETVAEGEESYLLDPIKEAV